MLTAGNTTYKITQKLSDQGGTATVWLAKNTINDRVAIIKVLKSTGIPAESQENLAQEATTQQRVSKLFSQLNTECGIDKISAPSVEYLIKNKETNQLGIIMNQATGQEVQDKLDASAYTNYKRELLTAVSTLHLSELVHWDIKPENIFWDNNTSKLTMIDFGTSQKLTPETRDALSKLVC